MTSTINIEVQAIKSVNVEIQVAKTIPVEIKSIKPISIDIKATKQISVEVSTPKKKKVEIEVLGRFSGTKNHSELNNLDFENSGHNGFASEAMLDEYAKLAILISLADIKTAILSSTLKPNQRYGIPDYQTSGYIKGTTEIFTAPVELIYVKATSVNTIHNIGYSGANNEELTVDLTPTYNYSSIYGYMDSYDRRDGYGFGGDYRPIQATAHEIEFNVDGYSAISAPSFSFDNKQGYSFATGDYEEGVDYEFEYTVTGTWIIRLLPDFEFYNEIDFSVITTDTREPYYYEAYFYYNDGNDDLDMYSYGDHNYVEGETPVSITAKSLSYTCPVAPVNKYFGMSDYIQGIDFDTGNYTEGVEYEFTLSDGVCTFSFLPAYEFYNEIDLASFNTTEPNTGVGYYNIDLQYIVSTTFRGIVGRNNILKKFDATMDYRATKTRRYCITAPDWNMGANAVNALAKMNNCVYVCVQAHSTLQNPTSRQSRYWLPVGYTTDYRYTLSGCAFDFGYGFVSVPVDTATFQDRLCIDFIQIDSRDKLQPFNTTIKISDQSNVLFSDISQNANILELGSCSGDISNVPNSTIGISGILSLNSIVSTTANFWTGVYSGWTAMRGSLVTNSLILDSASSSIATLYSSALGGIAEGTNIAYMQSCVVSLQIKRCPAITYMLQNRIYGPCEGNPVITKMQYSTFTSSLLGCELPGYVNNFQGKNRNNVKVKGSITDSNCQASWSNFEMGGYGNGINIPVSVNDSKFNTFTSISGNGTLGIAACQLDGVYSLTVNNGADVIITNTNGSKLYGSTFNSYTNISLCNIGGLNYGTYGEAPKTIQSITGGLINCTNHGLQANQLIRFKTTGTTPSGLGTGQDYWVMSTDFGTNQFRISNSFDNNNQQTPGSSRTGTLTVEVAQKLENLVFMGGAGNNYWIGTRTMRSVFAPGFDGKTIKCFNDNLNIGVGTAGSIVDMRDITTIYGKLLVNTASSACKFHVNGSEARTITYTNSTVTITDIMRIIEVGSGTFAFTLPLASAFPGRLLTFVNKGTGTITVNRTGSDTISGATSKDITQRQYFTIISDGVIRLVIG